MASKRSNETRGKRPSKPVESPREGDFSHRDEVSDQSLHEVTEHSMTERFGLEAVALRDHIGEVLPEFAGQAEATYSAGIAPRAAGVREGEPVDAWYGSYGTRLSRVLASRTDNPYSAAEMVAEVIIGEDDRRRVYETTKYPYGCICSLSILSRSGVRFVGTGWLADERTVVTAGHCLYMHREGGWAALIDVYPGRNGPEKPFAAKAARVWSTRGWTEQMNAPADYGAIRLDRPVVEVGTFGYAAESDAALRTAIGNVVGYPADKNGEMWGHARRFLAVRTDTLVYDIDTYGGNSGGPVIVVRGGDPVVVGIHNYGDYSGNSATRITPVVYQNIEGWAKAT
jgi:glutamyl endopeptidase